MRLTVNTPNEPLLKVLSETFQLHLNTHCRGNGRCGCCKVLLINGLWLLNHRECLVTSPMEALACQTMLLSASGELEIPASSLETPVFPSSVTMPRISEFQGKSPCLALDLGTTSLVSALLLPGEMPRFLSCYNQQRHYGDNLLDRLSYASLPDGGGDLQRAVVQSINGLLDAYPANIHLDRIVISGNTIMCCLLLGISPASLGRYPFELPCRTFPRISACKLGLHSEAELVCIPPISGYVGGDILSGLRTIDLHPGEGLVDIGTNCEIVINASGRVLAASAPAGPAFEGVGISCSAPAMGGTIQHIGPNFSLHTIDGSSRYTGLCASAFVDFLAVARRQWVLTSAGRLTTGKSDFAIADGIFITEKEIETLLKAKAAIYSGIQTLTESSQVSLKKLYLAGTIAQYLNLANAVQIRLLPPVELECLGNSSLAGAIQLASSPEQMEDWVRFASQVKSLELNELPSFETNYIDALFL